MANKNIEAGDTVKIEENEGAIAPSFSGNKAVESALISKELGREVEPAQMEDFFNSKPYHEYKAKPVAENLVGKDMVQFRADADKQLFIDKIAGELYGKQKDRAVLPDLLDHKIDVKDMGDKWNDPHANAFRSGFNGDGSEIGRFLRGTETSALLTEQAKIQSAGLFLRDLMQNSSVQKDALPSLESEALLTLISKGIISRDKIKREEVEDKSFDGQDRKQRHDVLKVKTIKREEGRITEGPNRGERIVREVPDLTPEEQTLLQAEINSIMSERLPLITEIRGFMEANGVHTIAQDRIDAVLAKFGYEFRKGEGYANVKDKNENLDVGLERAGRYSQGKEFMGQQKIVHEKREREKIAQSNAKLEAEAAAAKHELEGRLAESLQTMARLEAELKSAISDRDATPDKIGGIFGFGAKENPAYGQANEKVAKLKEMVSSAKKEADALAEKKLK